MLGGRDQRGLGCLGANAYGAERGRDQRVSEERVAPVPHRLPATARSIRRLIR
jgi:hypothetical protein